MLSSAVSFSLALAAGPLIGQLNAQEQQVWARVQPAVVTLMQGGQPHASAALIDEKGFFIAHRSGLSGSVFQARLASGATLTLRIAAVDEPTQFVLLKADAWLPSGNVRRLAPAAGKAGPLQPLLAVLPAGPVRAEYVSGERLGVLNSSKRLFPLSEIRFETNSGNVAGALLFNLQGEMLGILNATLEDKEEFTTAAALKQLGDTLQSADMRRFGPGRMTVAYAIGPDVFKRVVDGFRSPDHKVEHPSIGVFCRDAQGGGALVHQVVTGGPAHAAGLRSGDVIVEMDGVAIQNQVDFAKVMLAQSTGKVLPMKVRRGTVTVTLSVLVGK
jgi:putative serine protease PepD